MRLRIFFFALLSLMVFSGAVYAQNTPDAILSSDNPADRAMAYLLANHFGVPVITTLWGDIGISALNDVTNLNLSSIYAVGGDAALPGVINKLREKGIGVKQFNGSNRYETSAQVALEWMNASAIVVAYGYDEEGIENALVRAELEGAPLLLVPRDHIPRKLNETIAFLSPKKAALFPSPDMIQNFVFLDLAGHGMEVEIVPQDHRIKTINTIFLADAALLEAESKNFTVDAHEEARGVAGKLLLESRDSLERAEGLFSERMYHLAFTEAVLARFRAQNSMKIKRGAMQIAKKEEPKPKAENATVPISQILLHPTEFAGKDVLIKGTVEEAIEVAGKAFVKLFDGTGRIIITFPADRDYMLSKGLIMMADPEIIGKTVTVNGTLRINVPLGGGDHGAFAYLIEVGSVKMVKN